MADVKMRAGSPYWQVDFQFMGVAVRESAKTKNKREAQELADRRKQQIRDRLKMGRAPSITLRAACTRYFKTVLLPTGSPKSLNRDLGYLDAICTQFGETRLINTLTQAETVDWRDALAQRLKPASVNRLMTVLFALLARARDDWHVDVATFKVKRLPVAGWRVRFLPPNDVSPFLAAFRAEHARELTAFLLGSGLRYGEAMLLTWDRVEFYTCPKTGVERARVTVRAQDAKDEEARTVPVFIRASAALRWFQSHGVAQRLTGKKLSEIPVFQYRDPITAQRRPIGSIRKAFNNACERVNLTDFTIHDCRHHFASTCAQAGIRREVIQHYLGHASPAMTARYAHLCQSSYDADIALVAA